MEAKEIIDKAVEAIKRATNLGVKAYRTVFRGGAHATIKITKNDFEKEYAVECKRYVDKELIFPILNKFHEATGVPMILVAEYINEAAAEKLKAEKVPFFDAAGNTYIDEPGLYVDILGKRRKTKLLPGVPKGLAYQPGGLKVIFALLCDENLLERPVREIAEVAGVANGTVGWAMRDLKALGFLINMGGRKRRITERQKLLNEWVTHYPVRLRPKIILGKYKATTRDWWENNKPKHEGTYWGGEVAAAMLTKYLKPATFTLYTEQNPGPLIAKYNLKEDPKGEIEILRVFWKPQPLEKELGFVPPLLVYADLLAQGDPRNLETAKMIYDERLLEPDR